MTEKAVWLDMRKEGYSLVRYEGFVAESVLPARIGDLVCEALCRLYTLEHAGAVTSVLWPVDDRVVVRLPS
jgi:hypothetical protein